MSILYLKNFKVKFYITLILGSYILFCGGKGMIGPMIEEGGWFVQEVGKTKPEKPDRRQRCQDHKAEIWVILS